MPITISERATSRSSVMSASPTVDLQYVVDGTLSDLAVKGIMLANAPTVYDGLPLTSISIKPMDRPNLWSCSAHYSKKDKEDEEDSDPTDQLAFSWDTGGATTKLMQAIEQTGYAAGEPWLAPEFKKAINVSSNGDVGGVDIIIPKLSWEETHSFPAATLTTTWVKTVARNTGKTNSDAFRGFEAGEVLFLGASGNYSDKNVAVTYKFEASENILVDVGGALGVDKKGHDYLWTYYSEVVDGANKEVVPNPSAVYVAEVYESFAFSTLGISESSIAKKQAAGDGPGFGGGGDDAGEEDGE